MTSTSGLIVGSAISATNGVGSLGASGTYIVASIVSGTSVTYTATGGTTPVNGTITTITTTGATDVTANGGGLLIKGATDKTILWDSTNSNFTTSENWNIASGKVLKLNNTTLLGASNALPANFGGTGVLNNVLNTITFTGNFSLGLTLSPNTTLTLPTSGTVTALGNTTSGTGSTIVLNTTPSISYLQVVGSTGASQAPIKITSTAVLATPEVGTFEWDATNYYGTMNTTSGRGVLPVTQQFHLAANGTAITTIANFFGATSAINLEATSTYVIDTFCFMLKDASAGTVTWTATTSAATTMMRGEYAGTVITGFNTTVINGGDVLGAAEQITSTNLTFAASGSLSASVYHIFRHRFIVRTNTACNWRLNATVGTGNITPQAGSFYTTRKIVTNAGSYAA